MKGADCLANCYSCTLNPTVNVGEGQMAPSSKGQVVCWNKLEITGCFTESPHKIDNVLLKKAPYNEYSNTHMWGKMLQIFLQDGFIF